MKKIFVTLVFLLSFGIFANAQSIKAQIAAQEKIIKDNEQILADIRVNKSPYNEYTDADLEKAKFAAESNIRDANTKIKALNMQMNHPRPDINLGGGANKSNQPSKHQYQQQKRRQSIVQKAKMKARDRRIDAAVQKAQRKAEDNARRQQAGVNAMNGFDAQNRNAYQYKMAITERNNKELYNYARNSGFEERQERLRGNATKKPAPLKGVMPQKHQPNSANSVTEEAPKAQWQILVVPLNTDF